MNRGRGKENLHPTQFLLDRNTHKKLRIAAVEEGIPMAEALREAVILWLKNREQRPKSGRSHGR
jgi:hypothetical protein